MKVACLQGTREQLAEMSMEGLLDDFGLVIETPGPERVLDFRGQVYEVQRFSIDPPEKVLIECMRMIKETWEQRGKEGHLGHAVAGTWFFYWLSPNLERMEELVESGRVQDLRAAARDYINTDFGSERGPALHHQGETDGSERHPAGIVPDR